MKLLFASDVHGCLPALQKVIAAFEKHNVDKLVFLGDLLYHGPRNPLPEGYNPKEVAALLNSYKTKLLTVRGNCDAEVDQMLLQYPMMEDYELVEVNGHRCLLTHGHLFSEDRLPRLPFEIYLSGHTHVPVLEKRDNSIIYCNPGSVTFPKNEVGSSFGIMDEKGIYLYTIEGTKFKELLFE